MGPCHSASEGDLWVMVHQGLPRAHTTCRSIEENSRRVFEKWFNWSVMPDSRNPKP